MRPLLATLLTSLALVAPARAQSFNLDFEHELHSTSSLPDSYGGAPFLQGRWQKVVFPTTGQLAPTPLTSVYGLPTGVTVESDKTGAPNSPTCNPLWLSDDENLYDGILRQNGALSVTFRGLNDGWYRVYMYGVDDQAMGLTGVTTIRVGTSGGGTPVFLQNRALCSPPHQMGNSFAVTSVRVVGGRLSLRFAKGSTVGRSITLSAIQLDERVGATFCGATANSTGAPSLIQATSTQRVLGTASIVENNLTLGADHIPPGSVGFFIFSRTRHPGTGGFGSLGQGLRCLLGAVGRLPIADTQSSPGFMLHTLDYNAAPTSHHVILSGSTWSFQGYYTDPAAGGFNLTDATTVSFGN